MATVYAVLLLAGCLLALLLNVFSLPGNWVVLALLAVWKLTHDDGGLTWTFILVLVGLAALGEGLEFWAQAVGGKRYGATGRGNLGGIIGAIAGAVIGAPFFLGLGALVGALAGAWLGCWAFELFHGRPMAEARRAAWGAFWGKAFGFTLKTAIGAAMVFMSVPRFWP